MRLFFLKPFHFNPPWSYEGLTGRFLSQVTGHLLVVSSYRGLLAVSHFSGLLAVSFHSSLLAVSIYLLVRATVTCDL